MGSRRAPRGEEQPGGLLELDHHLGGRRRQALPGSHVERHAGPTPRLDRQAEGGERLHVGIGGDALLLAIAPVLAPHGVGRLDRLHGLEDLDTLVAQRLGPEPDRRLHAHQRDHLQEVVLDDVADGARLLVEPAPGADAEALGHGDLEAGHIAAVPQRLEQRVGEAEHQQVLDRFLAEVVVDPEDLLLGEVLVEDVVELLRRRQVTAEGLLDDDPGAAGHARVGQARRDVVEQARRDGQVEHRVLGAFQALGQALEGLRVLVVAARRSRAHRRAGVRAA